MDITKTDLIQKRRDFKWISTRQNSFRKLPKQYKNSVSELIFSGLYYENKRLKCAFCTSIFKTWPEEGQADVVHVRKNPNCPFIKHKMTGVLTYHKHSIVKT